jgi:hypothetical protein
MSAASAAPTAAAAAAAPVAPAAAAAAAATAVSGATYIELSKLRALMKMFHDRHTLPAQQDLFEELIALEEPARSRRNCPALRKHQIVATPVYEEEPDTYFLGRASRDPACHRSPETNCCWAVEIPLRPNWLMAQVLHKYHAIIGAALEAEKKERDDAISELARKMQKKKKQSPREEEPPASKLRRTDSGAATWMAQTVGAAAPRQEPLRNEKPDAAFIWDAPTAPPAPEEPAIDPTPPLSNA